MRSLCRVRWPPSVPWPRPQCLPAHQAFDAVQAARHAFGENVVPDPARAVGTVAAREAPAHAASPILIPLASDSIRYRAVSSVFTTLGALKPSAYGCVRSDPRASPLSSVRVKRLTAVSKTLQQ